MNTVICCIFLIILVSDEASNSARGLTDRCDLTQKPVEREMSSLDKYTQLNSAIQQTFTQFVNSTAMLRHQVH